MLFHVSDQPGIGRFEPRASKLVDEPVVWGVDGERLRNYLLPRECPRVTYYAGDRTTNADVDRFLGSSQAVIAVEASWVERLRRSCRLHCYHLPPMTFTCVDQCAGYFVSKLPVVPARVDVYDDPIAELMRRGVELRFLRSLWCLHDAVAASSLQFSMIRMRNAAPRASTEGRAPVV
jgi:hypothetical protein